MKNVLHHLLKMNEVHRVEIFTKDKKLAALLLNELAYFILKIPIVYSDTNFTKNTNLAVLLTFAAMYN